MKKKKKYYYSLFDEYRKIIVEMKFNQNFSNRNRLDEIVKELDKQISIFVTNINKRKFFIISSRIIYYCCYKKLRYLADKEEQLCALLMKIENREYIENEDYEDTYYKKSLIFKISVILLILLAAIAGCTIFINIK